MKKLLPLFLCLPLCAATIRLTWDTPTEQVELFKVFQATNVAGPYVLLGTTTNNVYSVDLTPGQYYFYATASNFWGESGPSNTATTPPPASIVKGIKIQR